MNELVQTMRDNVRLTWPALRTVSLQTKVQDTSSAQISVWTLRLAEM